MKTTPIFFQAPLLVGLLLMAGAAMAQAPAPNEATVANVTIMVTPGDTFNSVDATRGMDTIAVTYRRPIPQQKMLRDVAAVSAQFPQSQLNVQPFAEGGQGISPSDNTTYVAVVTLSSPNLISPGARHFDIEPYILAFKPYTKMRVVFIPRPGMVFDGLRNFQNPYVHIDFDQNAPDPGKDLSVVNAAYKYFVTIDNQNFTSLNLPLTSQDVAMGPGADGGRIMRLKIVLGIVLILALASLVGWAVYKKLNGVRNLYNKSLAVSNTRTTNKGLKNGR